MYYLELTPKSYELIFTSYILNTVPPQLLKMASRRNRSSVQPNKQDSTEGHRGKDIALSYGNNYFHNFIYFLSLPFCSIYHKIFLEKVDKLTVINLIKTGYNKSTGGFTGAVVGNEFKVPTGLNCLVIKPVKARHKNICRQRKWNINVDLVCI
jgi:hypothetical protein